MFTCKVNDEILLSMLEDRHAIELFALTDADREYLREWLPWVDATVTVDDTRAFISRSAQQSSVGSGFHAGIWFTGRLAGVIGFHTINRLNRCASMGYWLAREEQGRGIMTRSCRAMLEYAFNDLKLNRVDIRCATANVKSRAIPERLGLTHEGTLRQAEYVNDRFVDHEVYSMLASEWRQLT